MRKSKVFETIILTSLFFGIGNSLAVQPVRKPVQQNGTVKIKAGVVLNSGDVKYIAKQNFFLVTESLKGIKDSFMSGAEIASFAPNDPPCPNQVRLIEGVQKEIDVNRQVYDRVYASIKYICKTGFSGECSFEGVKPGKYFLVGDLFTQINQSRINWNFPIEVKAGKSQYIELSNDNSFLLWPIYQREVSTKSLCSY